MKLEAGRKYIRQDGGVTGRLILRYAHSDTNYPFEDPNSCITYREDGREFSDREGISDLIELYIETPPPPKPVLIKDPRWLTSSKEAWGKTVHSLCHRSSGLRVIYFETNEVLVTISGQVEGHGTSYISTDIVPKPAIPSSAPKPLLRKFQTHVAYLTELVEMKLIPEDSVKKQEEFDAQQAQAAEMELLVRLKSKYEGDYKC